MSKAPTEEGTVELPQLPRPACTYADHSYPAFSKRQMEDFARAAVLADRASRSPVVGAPSLPHLYEGDCPDEHQPDARDPHCPACQALSVVGALGGEPIAHVHIDGEEVSLSTTGPQHDALLRMNGAPLYSAPASPTAAGPMTEEQKDAARYRWLRQYGWPIYCEVFNNDEAPNLGTLDANAARLEAAIDGMLWVGGIGVSPTGSPEGEVSR